MPTLEEALSLSEVSLTALESDETLIIDPETRTISVPNSEILFGVESDEKVERKYFKVPRIVGDNIDLSTLQLRINYRNAAGETDQYYVDDAKLGTEAGETDYLFFSWNLRRSVTAYKGIVYFVVCAVSISSDGIVANEWNTTLAEGRVLEGLEVDDIVIEQPVKDIIAQLFDQVTNAKDQVTAERNKAVVDIATVGNNNIKSIQEETEKQKTALEQKGVDVNASIPAEYNSLSEQVEKNRKEIIRLDAMKVNGIEGHAEGSDIVIEDSAEAQINRMVIYGRTEQERMSGVQLFADDDGTANSNNVILERSKGVWKVTGTSIGNGGCLTLCGKEINLPAGTYTFTAEIIKKTTNVDVCVSKAGTKELMFVIPNVTTATFNEDVSIIVGINILAENTYDEELRISINSGSESLPWEPYTGGIPSPNPEYPQFMVGAGQAIAGRNLFLDTGTERKSGERIIAQYVPAGEPLVEGNIYTVSFCATIDEGVSNIALYFTIGASGASVTSINLDAGVKGKKVIYKTFTMKYATGEDPSINVENAKARLVQIGNNIKETTIHWFKIEKGDKATPWAPAPEDAGIETSEEHEIVDTGIEVEEKGKNLIGNVVKEQLCSYSAKTGKIMSDTTANTTYQYVKVQKYKNSTMVNEFGYKGDIGRFSLKFTKDSTFDIIVIGYNGNKEDAKTYFDVHHLINGKEYYVVGNVTKIGINDSVIEGAMITESSLETTYQPYRHQALSIPLPGGLHGIPFPSGSPYANYIDKDGQYWLCDTIEYNADGTAEYVQRVEKKTYNGSEKEIYDHNSGANMFGINNGSLLKVNGTDQVAFCDRYKYHALALNLLDDMEFTISISTDKKKKRIIFEYIKCKTLQEFKAELAIHPVTVIYALDIPKRFSLSAEQIKEIEKIRTFYPYTNININGTEAEVDYQVDMKAYIDKKISEIVGNA